MRCLLPNPSTRKARKFPQFVKASFLYDVNEVGNKFIWGFIICCILLLPAVALGQVRTVHAEWGYTSVSGLAGFRLYKDGNQACQTTNTTARAIDCSIDITTTPVSFTMTAFDTSGNESAHSSTFVVGNQAPTASVSATPISGYAPLLVSFDGSTSSDSDGSITSYSWNYGDGKTGTGAMVVHTFQTAGTYTVRLTVTDNYGGTGTATKTITVYANQAPTASISASVLSGDAPLAVNFDGSASRDSDGTIASYAWNFGDGGVASGRTASHTFRSAGTYSVTLRVTDDRGATALATKTVTVTTTSTGSSSGTSGNIAPLVTLAAYQGSDPNTPSTRIIVSAGKGSVELEAYAVDLNSGDTLTFNWLETQNALLLDGAITPAVGPDGEDASIFTFDPTGLVPGIYRLKVQVTDNGSPASSTTAELMVEVVDSEPNLGAGDSDGDGIADSTEGYADSDNDGIPNYLDAVSDDPTKLQTVAGEAYRWLLMTEAGLGLRLGSVAFASGNYIAGVTDSDIALNAGDGVNAAVASTNSMPTHIYDFQVVGLPYPGHSVKVVLPQVDAIPANAVYRKYFANLGWTDYIVNAQNRVASAPGAPGDCPPAGDSAYRDGLTQGDYCVQLTIEDGGPNDNDGEANAVIDDPSGVAQASSSLGVTSSSGSSVSSGGGGGGCTINKDANDSTLTMLLVLAVAYLFRRKERQGK